MVKTATPESSCTESTDRNGQHRLTKSSDRINHSESSSSSSCKYRGVRKRKWGKFVSEIRLPNSRERIWLGSYDSAVKAARAFDAALFCLRGSTAKFNFPDNPPEIPGGRSMTPAQIQAEAARFANSGLPIGSDQESWSNSESDEVQQADSPSLSDGANNMNTDSVLDNSFIDQFRTMSSDFGYFPGFDDYQNDFIMPPMTGTSFEVEEPSDEFFTTHGSFLWNFN